MTYDAGSTPPPGWDAPSGGQPGGQFGGQPGGQFGGQPGGQYGGQPGPYGAPPPGYIAPSPYGWGAPPRDHPNGTTILVLGILSLVACGLCGPFAWSMGNKAIKEMDSQPGANWSNRGNVSAGRVCGIIGTCILGLSVIWFLFVIGIFTSLASRG